MRHGCFCLSLHAEQVSARIVQEVTAEAVAVLKGEQESLADTAKRLPSGGFVTQAGEHTHTLRLLVKDVECLNTLTFSLTALFL